MSETKIKRRLKSIAITLSTSSSSATTIRLDDMAGAVVSFGTMSTSASTVQVYGCDAEDGEFRRLRDNGGCAAAITLQPSTSVGSIYAFPDAVFALPWAKLVSGDTHSTGVSGVVMYKS